MALVSLTFSSLAETVKDREAAVRGDRAAMEKDARWIYSDIQKGFAEAKRTGKPLLVVLRCVPCLSCAGIDAAVSLQDSDVAPLLDQFVCVRVINANALDLSLFQFDYDLSFSTLFFNGDGTVYGRYGSWTHQKNSQDKTIAGYKRALEGALALHRNYPANKSALAGKQGPAIPFKTPLDIPGIAGKYKVELDWQGKVVPSCVHCHQIGEALRANERTVNKTLSAESIYHWPAAETIGLTLAGDQMARIQSVAADSIAAKAGLQPGDDIAALAGQPLISIADVSWALDHAPEKGPLAARIKRSGGERTIDISLPPEWRMKADLSRRVAAWSMRAMATGGMLLEDLSDEQRKDRGLENSSMAILVKYLGDGGKHGAAKRAGFRKDDVIVACDGSSSRASESEMMGLLLTKHPAGDQVKATVLRGQERIDLTLPIQ